MISNQEEFNLLKSLREDIYKVFPKRADTLINLLDALITQGHDFNSIVQLSLANSFERQYSSINESIINALPQLDWTEIEKIILEYLFNRNDENTKYLRFILDCTSNTRKFSPKLEDKTIVYTPNQTVGNKPISPGHQYSCLSYLPDNQENSNWIVPVSTQRVKSTEKGHEAGITQLTQYLENHNLLKETVILIADSLYNTKNCHDLISKFLNIVHISRLRKTRNIFLPHKCDQNCKENCKKKFGEKFNLQKDNLPFCDEEKKTTFINKKGEEFTVIIQSWKDIILRGSHTYKSYNHPINIIKVTILDKNSKYLNSLWLSCFGSKRNEIDILEIYNSYKSRYDIEHLFRFAKQKLLFDKFQTPEVINNENWCKFSMLGYTLLFFARNLVQKTPHPWEKNLESYKNNNNNSTATASQTQRGFKKILTIIGTPAKKIKVKIKSGIGREKGLKINKRENSDVIYKRKRKEVKKELLGSENRQKISNPKSITSLVFKIKTQITNMGLNTQEFVNKLLLELNIPT